ncbi:MAG: hypothetical protein ACXVB1_12145, partial [Pseudobdellovibrionaceae bacterium]
GGATGMGGGGDSDAVDVLTTIKTLNQWLSKSHIGLSKREKTALSDVAQKISKDMDDPNKTPIRMVDYALKDASGTDKMALFSKNPFSIRVQRTQWKPLDQKDKFILIGLELFGLAGIPDRYNLAGNILKQVSSLSTIRDDLQLFNFIVGSWKMAGGICLSGMPVNWGGDPSDVANYEIQFKFNVDYFGETKLLYKGNLKVKSKNHFSVQKANLTLNTLETCQYEATGQTCESDLANESNYMLSIQGEQLWLLSNQGVLGGSCGAQDIFVMKLNRQ